MAKITRYPGDLKAFASAATGTERTIFGDTAQADDLASNITADFLRGWGIIAANETPTKQDFNALAYTISQLVAYQHQMGVPEWDDEQEYHADSVCNRNGVLYTSLINTNVGNDPATDDGTNWYIPNPNQASTAQGGTGTEDGADTWAKLAEFVISGVEGAGRLHGVIMAGYGAPELLHVDLFLDVAASVYSFGEINVTENTRPVAISNDGMKLTAASTTQGTVVEFWINKNRDNEVYYFKELGRFGFSSITYSTDAAWQSAEPTGAFEVVSAAAGIVVSGNEGSLKTKIIEIGDWNMDSTTSINVAHGLTMTNVRNVTAMIRNDGDTARFNFGGNDMDRLSVSATNVLLSRVTSGIFDSTDFDSTSYNRGWITIQYV